MSTLCWYWEVDINKMCTLLRDDYVIKEHEGSGDGEQGGKCLGCQSDILNAKDNSVWLAVSSTCLTPKVIHQILPCLNQEGLRFFLFITWNTEKITKFIIFKNWIPLLPNPVASDKPPPFHVLCYKMRIISFIVPHILEMRRNVAVHVRAS